MTYLQHLLCVVLGHRLRPVGNTATVRALTGLPLLTLAQCTRCKRVLELDAAAARKYGER